jgi:hypothetical protein
LILIKVREVEAYRCALVQGSNDSAAGDAIDGVYAAAAGFTGQILRNFKRPAAPWEAIGFASSRAQQDTQSRTRDQPN